MLVQHDDNDTPSTPSAGESGQSPTTSRPCLRVEPWLDPVIDELGHDPRSAYVETFWLPVLGPSTTWLLRHLTARLEESPEGIELDIELTARSLGLGERMSPNAPFARTLKRCVDFSMAEWRGPLQLAVRRRLPPLARRHLRRLPESLQARHDAANQARRPVPAVESLRRHGCQLALSLVDLGEDQRTTEQQLRRWKFHPALATECAAWAVEEQARRTVAGGPTDC
ncbi:MAG TPA: hypothetical protein VK217_00455 [Acidimicrobiales bacterium]|nr:hypothetical protein [Acidimicrobiales bacterium]